MISNASITVAMRNRDQGEVEKQLKDFFKNFKDGFEGSPKKGSDQKLVLEGLRQFSKTSKLREIILPQLKTYKQSPELKKLIEDLSWDSKDEAFEIAKHVSKLEKLAKKSENARNIRKKEESKCKSIDLIQDGPLPKNSVRNQDGFGTCYAQTAAVLLDSWRFTHSDSETDNNRLTSPILTLSNLQKSNGLFGKKNSFRSGGDFWFEGGQTSSMLKAVKKKGEVCTYSHVNTNSQNSEPEFTLDNEASQIQKLYDVYNAYKTPLWNQDETCQKDVPLEYPLIDDIGEITFRELIKEVAEAKCNPAPIKNLGKIYEKSFFGTEASRRKQIGPILDKWFSRTPTQPLAINYCARVLATNSRVRWLPGGRRIIGDCGHHASVIIGRKFEEGKCRVRILNSWGKGCDRYNPHNTIKYFKCEEGTFWVNQDDLSKFTMGFSGILD
jgi:hypothetical protein